ncbi:hypothetical protein [uncultured Psychrobacter sp.]|uniref:hypothetical protein n=1 Tax=uncultured Psychrobacter sp. TaxID=259303 RepID=UPI0026193AE2|nr:hypothetical protein [uncultured Psychrobacter sp.]
MTVHLAQQILLAKFKQEPFHNLYLLNNVHPATMAYGGTCSDKALSYLDATKAVGLDAYLHSARIGGQDIHRLVRLEINNQRYFADIGNGWPSIQLIPAATPILYECYGMRFRTTIENDVITVYHRKRNVEKKQMEIDIAAKSETEIYHSIENRFSADIIYPFSSQLRFSMVVGKRFLFIRDTQLEIYSNSGYEEELNISMNNLQDVIEEYFGYDIKPLESQFSNRN